MNAARPGAALPDLKTLLPVSPDAYPQAVDLVRGLVLVIRMDARAYRAASFLDDRILGPSTEGAWIPGAAVTQAARQVAGAQAAPFHLPHRARRLDAALAPARRDGRRPRPSRAAAASNPRRCARRARQAGIAPGQPRSSRALLDMLLGLWSRGYEATRAVVVKATSSAGRLAPRLLGQSPASRAVYLNLAAEPYLATLLGGANSATDLRGHGPGRMRRLLAGRELPVAPLYALSTGELAALGWLVESLSQAAAQEAAGARLLALDFDAFLADVPGEISKVLAHFGLPRDDASIAAIAGSAVLRQYSKAPEQPFPPGERAARLAAARRDHSDEIAKGLAWLERLARADASIAAVVRTGRAHEHGRSGPPRTCCKPRAVGQACGRRVGLPPVHRRGTAERRRTLQLRLLPAAPRTARGSARRAPVGARPRHREARGSALEHGRDPGGAAARRGGEAPARARAHGQPDVSAGALQPGPAVRGTGRPRPGPRALPPDPRDRPVLARCARAHRARRDRARSRRRNRPEASSRAAPLEPRSAHAREPAFRARQGPRRLRALRRGFRAVRARQCGEPAAPLALRSWRGGRGGRPRHPRVLACAHGARRRRSRRRRSSSSPACSVPARRSSNRCSPRIRA